MDFKHRGGASAIAMFPLRGVDSHRAIHAKVYSSRGFTILIKSMKENIYQVMLVQGSSFLQKGCHDIGECQSKMAIIFFVEAAICLIKLLDNI